MKQLTLDKLSEATLQRLSEFAAQENITIEEAVHWLVEWAAWFKIDELPKNIASFQAIQEKRKRLGPVPEMPLEMLPTHPSPEEFKLPPRSPKLSDAKREEIRELIEELNKHKNN